MTIKVRLSDGSEFTLESSLDEFEKAVRLALENSRVLEVRNGGGKMRLINPVQIAFVEEAEDSSARTGAPLAARG
jgi:hypothetical protein